MRITFTTIFITALMVSSLWAQNFPFPQSKNWPGAIKPSHKTQEQLNKAVSDMYDMWKADFLKPTDMEGGYYIKGGCTGCTVESKGTSEGHGYGMIIIALMAGYDTDAKMYFDGLYHFFNNYRSTTNNELMNWNVAKDEREPWTGSATDGDFDIAYALILAHYQWGSDGTINYLQEAIDMINLGLKAGDMSTVSKRVMMGDWDNNKYSTRPSDWMTDHFRAFSNVTGDNFWMEAADTIYSIADHILNHYSPNTGLMPDFVIGSTPQPASANFLEGPYDGYYYYNACRYPWRITTDYLHYGTMDAKHKLAPFLEWANNIVKNGYSNYTAGYTLDGTAFTNYDDHAFIAPLVLAFTTDEKYQTTLNQGWDYIEKNYWGYYDGSLNMLCQLMITGNWWVPANKYENKEYLIGGKVIGYFPTWSGSVSNIQFDKLTHINYSFLLPNADGTLQNIENAGKLTQLVTEAHNQSVKVSIAIGGWNNGDDSAFEAIAADSATTVKFVSEVMKFVRYYNLDGVDMDWEYPNSGQSANNFVSMMTVFADSLQKHNKLLTAAVIGKEWDKNSIPDSTFALVDWLNIMAYDNGSEANHSTYNFAKSCLDYWQNTRSLPKEKTVLGVPFYSLPSYRAYSDLVNLYPEAPNTDHVGTEYYNGKPTMNQKVELAKERCAGTMIWEISQDTFDQETSLLTTIYNTYKDSYVSIKNQKELQLNIFPNPVSDILTIELPNGTRKMVITIFDQCGRMVKQEKFENRTQFFKIDLQNIENGIYFVECSSTSRKKITKIVKH